MNPLSEMSFGSLLWIAMGFRVLFPVVFAEAVVSAAVEQWFYRDICDKRSDRLILTLRANFAGAAGGILAFCVNLAEDWLRLDRLLPHSLDVLKIVAWTVIFFGLPMLAESFVWKRWATRKLLPRVVLVNLLSIASVMSLVWIVRFWREHLPHSWTWNLRRFETSAVSFAFCVSAFCLVILIVACVSRVRTSQIRPQPSESAT